MSVVVSIICVLGSRDGEHDVRSQRVLLALALATTVGLATGCTQQPDNTAAAAQSGAASSAAAPSPTVDVKANTEAVCTAVKAVYEAEEEALLPVVGELAAASVSGDKAAQAKAQAKGEVILGRISKAVDAELAKAVDPAVKTAIANYAATIAKMLRAEKFGDPSFDAEIDKVNTEVEQYCPGMSK
ncbi:hypothetical protein AB0K00_36260 [Dactylosporangium sp. NPDC049525]|uniref:hypothetical protein n=1 Tax=Dactylosporangium sp. NPDC049525 TaxID=3154730 RepID=UPI00344AF43A